MQTVYGLTSLCVAAALVLSACGGGGSGYTPPPAITVVSGTPADLSVPGTANKIAVDASSQTITQGLSLEDSGQVPVLPAAQASQSLSPSRLVWDGLAQHWVGAALALASSNSTPKALSAAEASKTVSCPGGGQATLSENRKSTLTLNKGDTITLSATNCTAVADGTKVWMDGSFSMTIDEGSMVSPKTLFGATVSMRMTHLHSQITESGAAPVTVGVHGGMQMIVTSNSVRIKSLPDVNTLTQVNESKTPAEKTTLSEFDYTIGKQTNIRSLFSGFATVDTTRVSTLTGGATRYTVTVPTFPQMSVDPTTGLVLSGRATITSSANGSTVRLNYGAACSNTTNCVILERDTGSGYTVVGTYSWADFLALNK